MDSVVNVNVGMGETARGDASPGSRMSMSCDNTGDADMALVVAEVERDPAPAVTVPDWDTEPTAVTLGCSRPMRVEYTCWTSDVEGMGPPAVNKVEKSCCNAACCC